MFFSRKGWGVLLLVSMMAIVLHGCAISKKGQGAVFGVAQGMEEDPWGRSESELRAERVYHFGFDRYDLSDKDLYAVRAQAYFLKNKKNTFTIFGYTDDRGSAEYNIALGERRAKAVAAVLYKNGIARERINIVSYGKESPVNLENNEAAWAENRRAVISYDGYNEN
jgi:peptidoglycan-associated lipoprotein